MIGDDHTLWLQQSRYWDGKNRVGLRAIQSELVKWRYHSYKRRDHEVSRRRHLIQPPEHPHVRWLDADLFMAFPQSRFEFATIISIHSASRESHLTPMMIELLRALGEY
jgi:hypothetical protein